MQARAAPAATDVHRMLLAPSGNPSLHVQVPAAPTRQRHRHHTRQHHSGHSVHGNALGAQYGDSVLACRRQARLRLVRRAARACAAARALVARAAPAAWCDRASAR